LTRAALAIVLALTGCPVPLPRATPVREPPTTTGAEPPAAPEAAARVVLSFASAKRHLERDVYFDHRVDLYCGCAYDDDEHVDAGSCGLTARRNEERAGRIEWEHMVPAARFGQHRACWRGETCERHRGRDCCSSSPASGGDEEFRAMEGDMHNLVPSVGELNGDRSNRPYGIVDEEPREYGACDFEIDRAAGRDGATEPMESIRGDVARAWLYMSAEWGMELTADERELFEAWHREDRADAWEIERNERIARVQGNANTFVRP
jgi:deoxyribonuclease-1